AWRAPASGSSPPPRTLGCQSRRRAGAQRGWVAAMTENERPLDGRHDHDRGRSPTHSTAIVSKLVKFVVVKKIRDGGQWRARACGGSLRGSEERANIGPVFKRSLPIVFIAVVPLRRHYAPKS